jgi:hypothetical protein
MMQQVRLGDKADGMTTLVNFFGIFFVSIYDQCRKAKGQHFVEDGVTRFLVVLANDGLFLKPQCSLFDWRAGDQFEVLP